MAECDYTELHVVMDGANPQAHARGAAILAALDEEAWDVARVEQRAPTQRISQAPDYAEVVMSPTPLNVGEPLRDPTAGVQARAIRKFCDARGESFWRFALSDASRMGAGARGCAG
ncbi:MAG: hypothetical protein M0D54_04355 [Hyphomonadaceae bacterium JAD_PAG50586_4]|nr:MAG: hypothetical protein M0D54_04355 [Hyphomonadaceae bacterium JAD_PAG50586_4]